MALNHVAKPRGRHAQLLDEDARLIRRVEKMLGRAFGAIADGKELHLGERNALKAAERLLAMNGRDR